MEDYDCGMYLIGLTGGIASGKSVVGARLRELGAVHIDADVLARDVVAPGTPGLDAIRAEFGDDVIDEGGALDRAALGAIVFADPDRRRLLEQITHPAVRAEAKRRMSDAAAADPSAIVVYDVPLLVEAGPPHQYDTVLVTHATTEERRRRLVDLRGMEPAEADRRIASQATDEERFAVADAIIDTNGTMEQTIAQVDRFWASLPR